MDVLTKIIARSMYARKFFSAVHQDQKHLRLFCKKAVLVLACAATPLPAAETADLILYNGKILTVDAQDHIYSAIAVKQGKILQVGPTSEILPLAGLFCKMLDLNGKTLTPGLIDAHYHLMHYGAQFWPGYLNIRPPIVECKADLLREISNCAATLPPGQWISANQGFQLKANETLDRFDLDAIAPNHPVYLLHGSGHYAVVNTLALTTAGISSTTPNPPGSLIIKDGSGQPNGILVHYGAENLVARHATGYGDRSDVQKFKDIKVGQTLCLQAGYTSIQDVIIGNARDIALYRQFADSGLLKVRLYLMQFINTEAEADSVLAHYRPIQQGRLKFGGWSLAQDGDMAARTLLMYDKTQFGAAISFPYHDQENFYRIVRKLHDSGEQIAVHVSGDQGMDMTLTAFEQAMQTNPRPDPRHRIEHGLFPMTSALQRMKEHGIILSTQPQWLVWFGNGYKNAFNDEAMSRLLPLKTMYNMGVPLAFGCDVPASKYQEPKWAFYGALLRRTDTGTLLSQSERLLAKEALRIHTMGSAYASFAEKETGSLEPDKFADMVIWSKDLSTMAPGEALDLNAEMTIVEGEIVFDAGKNPCTFVPGFWSTAGNMAVKRRHPSATLLLDGQVLIIGSNAKAELYNSNSGQFVHAGYTVHDRGFGHTATLLRDGRVLIVGGYSSPTTAEIYNPTSGLFSLPDTLNRNYIEHTATLLPDGRVLLAGGCSRESFYYLKDAAMFDPATNTCSPTNSLTHARGSHTATLLPNGLVLIAGGETMSRNGVRFPDLSSELYNPTTGTFTAAANLNYLKYRHTATLLADGRVLLIGNHFQNVAELYDYKTNTCSVTNPMNCSFRVGHISTLLPSGKVLIAGGFVGTPSRASAEVFFPETNSFCRIDSLITPRIYHAATLLNDGRVFVIGGDSGEDSLISAELYSVNLAGLVHVSRQEKTGKAADLFTLSPNYPNPFNATTRLNYTVGRPGRVRVMIYNLLGEKVKTLLDKDSSTGQYQISWNGVDESNRPMASGVYFIKMEADRQVVSRKMLLLR